VCVCVCVCVSTPWHILCMETNLLCVDTYLVTDQHYSFILHDLNYLHYILHYSDIRLIMCGHVFGDRPAYVRCVQERLLNGDMKTYVRLLKGE
jgi:hypothetical protein